MTDRAFEDTLAQLREFLRKELPDEVSRKHADAIPLERHEVVAWQQALNAQGWATPRWPVEWGGMSWSASQHLAFRRELQRWPAPEPLVFNAGMLGPTLIAFGSDEQKKRFLPRAANLDDWWCQGFSEPNAGSDLASMKTRAVKKGDEYVVNGQKTWTSYAQYADWMFALVKTNTEVRPQAGISFMLIDMRSPGITVRPIETIDGHHEINEVYFDDVKVPIHNLVGKEGEGWSYAKYLLSHERAGIARTGLLRALLKALKGRVATGPRYLQERLLAVEANLFALEATELKALECPAGTGDTYSSVLKLKGSELQQELTECAMEAAGGHAAMIAVAGQENWMDQSASTFFNRRKLSIFGGSSEIQRTILATKIL